MEEVLAIVWEGLREECRRAEGEGWMFGMGDGGGGEGEGGKWGGGEEG